MGSTIGADAFVAGGALEGGRQPFNIAAFASAYGGVTVSRYRSGALLYAQGEPADAMHYLHTGKIQITVVSSRGKEGILHILTAGDFCGEGCLVRNHIRESTALCLTDSLVARLERTSIIRALHEDPGIGELFVAFALNKVSQLRANLLSQLFDSSEQRLARALLQLANNDGQSQKVIRNIDQETLAQMIGTTRSRVNHFMNKFRKQGYVEYDGNVIFVRNSLAEVTFAESLIGTTDETMGIAC